MAVGRFSGNSGVGRLGPEGGKLGVVGLDFVVVDVGFPLGLDRLF